MNEQKPIQTVTNENNSMGSQSRIRVNLTHEGQKLQMDDDNDNEEHTESPGLMPSQRPTLT